ncbi:MULTISPECIES: sigma 54-interacting transcriptional regulator [unclassified Bacillus (in: firmicutes)]|uniref:sigma 54-interacting transcriptional regulator n=1 Tax=unclassified Bacillus (in: firmicutes) TaxID=185979 RepID=UPI00163C4618|nr:sigma-54-dependent transcriptional regulator [Bacillus sp. PAMC26543]QNH41265.1 sigma 54-interacting transcriptional regulator [Bacillus sp. PAMC26543]
MKRIDKIYHQLMHNFHDSSLDHLLKVQGNSAKEIAQQLKIERSNVSFELNNLVRSKKVIKIKTFPVRYIPVEVVERAFNKKWNTEIMEVKELKGLSENQKKNDQNISTNPLELMIGAKGSLKKAISQAKAAVFYPPHGLHMLLLGPTGSGKSLFANRIYQFAIYSDILKAGSPFITFNCADYYNNPQLLLSQLFGHKKGAFTGASEDKAGLVEQADGGILFMDEIHRLPPEGQEMLFYFIDSGSYNRLGETEHKRTSKVLFICATTENPNSALLKTFLRRIPMTIHIPSLEERSLKERVDLTTFLLGKEAERIKKNLSVHIDVYNALIHSAKFGNVGQLKSNVQLVCAHGFLHNLDRDEVVELTVRDLPDEIKQDWMSSSKNMKRSKTISEYVNITTIISPIVEDETTKIDDDLSFNLYHLIEEKVEVLNKEGLSKKEINQYILTDIHLHVRSFFNQSAFRNDNLLTFVEDGVIQMTKQLKEVAEHELNCTFDRKFIYFLSMHIDSFLKRGKQIDILNAQETDEIRDTHVKEYQVALIFKDKIQEHFRVTVPEIEVIYLTMLIHSIKTLKENKRVGIVVAAHGNSMASSMVEVATELLGSTPIAAVDMPLSVSPAEIMECLAGKIQQVDEGEGVLMLVDMGSLAMLESKLEEKTGIKIKTISNVTTSMVLDAVRKVNYLNLHLHAIYDSVTKDFIELWDRQPAASPGKKRALVSICTTGRGTAKKLEDILTTIVNKASDVPIHILTVSSIKLANSIKEIEKEYEILATVGTKDPKINAPHVSLEVLIGGEGEKMIQQAITKGSIPMSNGLSGTNIIVRELCEDSLKKYLVFLNPHHIIEILLEWLQTIQDELGIIFNNTVMIKVIMHTAFAFERVIKQNPIAFSEEDEITDQLKEIFEVTERTLIPYEQKLGLNISDDEKLFIAAIFADEVHGHMC